ncbi:MAG TPA: single-stranded-DNA-specific exonuclease RecJ [Rugosibacter sp.]|nr:single-stranded-DNA-specific exonuclease RecJ [Rugosibacter sp.]HPB91151.1 single-stranded-DNA-specific exonuclease RecJ [Rugosibacter sp.]HQN46514.1 single-stranded-DNA-specific exonuclease RecJ [Rugosibacter sp.]HQQ35143.1 single-stranded-DNA-specific exonuclease RecJ [Rugosibacter sp.]
MTQHLSSIHIQSRNVPPRAAWALQEAGVHPLLSRLYAARGVRAMDELDTRSAALLPPDQLKGATAAASLLADAIAAKKRLLIVADYDCDGATACAVGLRALRMMGATVDYLVPDRFKLGYGLSLDVAKLAAEREPNVVITVDNGIASIEGVAELKARGIQVVITDHHLPGDMLPAADVIVNPNQPGCHFPSKALAGVGVMFYVALALRAELRQRGAFSKDQEPNLASLLDLVALGTVADVVALDRNNRILVTQGLTRMRAGHMQPGVQALFAIAGRDATRAATFDLGFMLGPRLNAAGRLADMSLGIEGLTTNDTARALNIAQQLDAINRERRVIETSMKEDAEMILASVDPNDQASIVLFDPDWHQGVIGILAGRVKEKFHRPTFAFARGEDGELKASGRSIPGLHLRDALDLVSKRASGLLLRFGGHAAAAGLTLEEDRLTEFEELFEAVCQELLSPADLQRTLETDGALESGYFSLDAVRLMQQAVWGQAFPAPIFDDTFDVTYQKVLKDKHLKLRLKKGQTQFDAIQFNFAGSAPNRIHAAFRLDINEWNGNQSVQLLLEHFEEAT